MRHLTFLALRLWPVVALLCGCADQIHGINVDCKDDAKCATDVEAALSGIDARMFEVGVSPIKGLLTDFYAENGLMLTIYGSDAAEIGCPDGAIGCTSEREGSIYIHMYRGQDCEVDGGTLSHENLHSLDYAMGGDGDSGHTNAGWWGRNNETSYESQLAKVDWCSFHAD